MELRHSCTNPSICVLKNVNKCTPEHLGQHISIEVEFIASHGDVLFEYIN